MSFDHFVAPRRLVPLFLFCCLCNSFIHLHILKHIWCTIRCIDIYIHIYIYLYTYDKWSLVIRRIMLIDIYMGMLNELFIKLINFRFRTNPRAAFATTKEMSGACIQDSRIYQLDRRRWNRCCRHECRCWQSSGKLIMI